MNRTGCSLALLVIAASAAACSEPPPGGGSQQTAQQAPGPAAPGAAPQGAGQPAQPLQVTPAALPVPPPQSTSPEAQAIDATQFTAAADAQTTKRILLKAQVLLDRAHISPGVIDGQTGGNMRHAVSAFEAVENLPVDGQLDPQVWAALTQADAAPVMQDYVISDEDVRGPFVAKIPTDYAEMAKLEKLAYASPVEMLAERFHMDEALLKTLNPNADFSKAGTTIVVVRPGEDKLPAEVARVEVDKSKGEVRAYGADQKLLAVYPATVGSTERPAPSGDWAVKAVAPNPTWTYDPERLTFGKEKKKLTIAAGPNNPVGDMWIDLTKETYGIHGTPDPRLIGKRASHGCVRLTNWDATELGSSIQKGAAVVFMGSDAAAKKTKA